MKTQIYLYFLAVYMFFDLKKNNTLCIQKQFRNNMVPSEDDVENTNVGQYKRIVTR